MWYSRSSKTWQVLKSMQDKEAADAYYQNNRKDSLGSKSSEACSPEMRGDSIEKCAVPPTAVVTPVVHKSKSKNPSTQTSEKRVTFKRKISVTENSPDSETLSAPNKSPLIKKKNKHVSPLNKSSTEVSDALLNRIQSPSIEKMAEDEMCNSILPQSASASSINDVEMRDVSAELLDDLAEKKETVFDTTACYYIVVDTNVLIGELDLINELKDTPLDGCGPPHIFIPWVVIEELDKLKSQKTTKVYVAASEAIRFLNSVLSKHPRFHGQSPAEAEDWAKTYSKNNDDKILECCIGLSTKMPAEKVILLTNDKNLVNKALIHKINVHNFESMIRKVKPDTKFNCEEMKSAKKRKRDKEAEAQKELNESQITNEGKALHSRRDKCKCEIHNIMSNARQLLKDILSRFLSEEMFEAYGEVWLNFPIEKKLLKGVLEGILKYWRAVFYELFTERDKRNIELLLEKAKRPEGFLGDKDECLVILSAVEDLFRQIKKRQPKLNVPVELIQEYRVACVSAFSIYSEAESELRLVEDKSVREVLDDNWTAINQLCGVIMDHYGIAHDFDYYGKEFKLPDMEIKRLMVIVLPAVQKMKRQLCQIFSAVKSAEPVKKAQVKKLVNSLLEFIPSLNLPYEPKTYGFFNTPALEKWLTSPQNREKIERGIMQIEKFLSKLDEAFLVIVRPCQNLSL